jgi:peptide/nickel transport system permease protein
VPVPARAWRARRSTALWVSGGILVILALACVLAPVVAPYDPTAQDPTNAFAPLTGAHLFGTDELGRDLFSRTLYGGRLSLLVAGGGVLIAFVLGTLWGFLAATRRGLLDELLMRSADALMAIPQILFALVCVAAFGASLVNLALIIGILLAPSTARMARSVALNEVTRDYYSAAIAYGASPTRLLLRELLPNTTGALAIQGAINAANAIILEASLSFVGLGVQPPDASWGTLLQQGYSFLYQQFSYAFFPGVGILLTIGALNVLVDQLGARNLAGGRR